MGFLKFCKNFTLFSIVLTLILLYVPGIPPDVQFSSFKVDPQLPRKGPLAKNSVLDDAERLHEGYLVSPESLASRAKDEVIVSLHNGNIVRVFGKDFEKTEVITNLGPGCAGPHEEHICGRPLGLRFHGKDKLLVADAFLGIFSIDLKTGKHERLVDVNIPIGGLKPMIPNDLDIDSSGNIYWSDASSKVHVTNALIDLLSDPSGRLIKYNPKTKKCEVLLSGLHFANGVQLSPDQQFVLVSETSRHRVTRYWLKGPKAGTSDVFVSNLPGMPDNIRQRAAGGYYVSLVEPRSPEKLDLYELMSELPGVRKVLIRMMAIVQMIADTVNYYFPNYFWANLSYKTFHLGVISQWSDYNETIVVEVDALGNIIGSLQGSKGVVKMISETQQVGDYLFFGSPFANYLGRIPVKKTLNRKPKTEKKETETHGKEEL